MEVGGHPHWWRSCWGLRASVPAATRTSLSPRFFKPRPVPRLRKSVFSGKSAGPSVRQLPQDGETPHLDSAATPSGMSHSKTPQDARDPRQDTKTRRIVLPDIRDNLRSLTDLLTGHATAGHRSPRRSRHGRPHAPGSSTPSAPVRPAADGGPSARPFLGRVRSHELNRQNRLRPVQRFGSPRSH